MLNKVLDFQPFPYRKGVSGNYNIAPWTQTTYYIAGMAVLPCPDPTAVTPTTANSVVGQKVSQNILHLYVWFTENAYNLIHLSISDLMFDTNTGAFLGRNDVGQPNAFFFCTVDQGASGTTYFNTGAGGILTRGLLPFDPNSMANAGNSWQAPTTYSFLASNYLGTNSEFDFIVVDENNEYLLTAMTGGTTLSVFNLTTYQRLYDLNLPAYVMAMCRMDTTRVLILMDTGMVMTLDYSSGTVLGALYLAPPAGGSWKWNGSTGASQPNTAIYFNALKGQLYVCQQRPNAADGSNTTYISAYSLLNNANRMTPPIPLESPRVGKTIRVMSQIVNELNMGVGGATVSSVGTGSGSVVGPANSDAQGRAFSKVLCTATGSAAINCNATVPDVT